MPTMTAVVPAAVSLKAPRGAIAALVQTLLAMPSLWSDTLRRGAQLRAALTALGVAALCAIVVRILQRRLIAARSRDKEAPVTLQGPQHRIRLRLIERERLSRNVRRLRFALPSVSHRLGLPVGKHMSLCYQDEEGRSVTRAYTPLTNDNVRGFVDLVIKVYFANEHPRFPLGGKMSQYLDALPIGGEIECKGPIGKLEWVGRGRLAVGSVERTVRRLNMIAGGTGITPMLQLINAVLADPDDATEVSLLFANQSPEDVFMQDEIDRLAQRHPGCFRRWYTVDRAADGWPYSTGFVDKDMCGAHLFPTSPDTVNLLCGPPPMLKFACRPSLSALGHDDNTVFNF